MILWNFGNNLLLQFEYENRPAILFWKKECRDICCTSNCVMGLMNTQKGGCVLGPSPIQASITKFRFMINLQLYMNILIFWIIYNTNNHLLLYYYS